MITHLVPGGLLQHFCVRNSFRFGFQPTQYLEGCCHLASGSILNQLFLSTHPVPGGLLPLIYIKLLVRLPTFNPPSTWRVVATHTLPLLATASVFQPTQYLEGCCHPKIRRIGLRLYFFQPTQLYSD